MTLTQFKGIVFDKDGTLLDFQASWGGWSADLVSHLTKGDTQRTAALAELLDVDLSARRVGADSVIIAGTPFDIVETIVGFFPERDAASMMDQIVALSEQVMPVAVSGLADTMSELERAGLRLGVATNDAEEIAKAQMDALGIARHFSFVAGFDSGYGGKPAPGMCLGFSKTLGIAPEDCVMVGDSLHDLDAGRAAGMATVAVLTGVATEADLAPHADVVLPDVTHLPKWLGV